MAFSMSGRTGSAVSNSSPGPGAYTTDRMHQSPSFSMGVRSSVPISSDSPGLIESRLRNRSRCVQCSICSRPFPFLQHERKESVSCSVQFPWTWRILYECFCLTHVTCSLIYSQRKAPNQRRCQLPWTGSILNKLSHRKSTSVHP